MTFEERLRARLLETGLATQAGLVGLDDEAIDQLESAAELRFPAAYRAFLRVCGGGAGRFFQSTDMFGAALPRLRRQALAILAEEPEPPHLSTTALVFGTHGGYQLWAMETTEGDPEDPPVYYFVMEQPALLRVNERFTEFIESAIEADRAFLG